MYLVGVVVKRYIYFIILLIPTTLVSTLFCSSILHLKKIVFSFFIYNIIAQGGMRP